MCVDEWNIFYYISAQVIVRVCSVNLPEPRFPCVWVCVHRTFTKADCSLLW